MTDKKPSVGVHIGDTTTTKAGRDVVSQGGGESKKHKRSSPPWGKITVAALVLATALVGAGVIGCPDRPIETPEEAHESLP